MNRLLEGKYVYPNCLDDLTTKQIIKLRHHYMEIIQAKEGKIDSGKLLIDKMPLDIVHIGLICRIFPDAKILVALRDPRDVILSCFMQHFAPNSAMRHFYTLEDTVDMYCNVMQLYLRYQDIFERKPHSFRYEDMVTDQKATLSAIIEYLGLGWQEDMLKFYDKKNIQNVFTPSYQGVSQPVYRSAQGRWKHYERYFKPYQGKLAPLLDALGY